MNVYLEDRLIDYMLKAEGKRIESVWQFFADLLFNTNISTRKNGMFFGGTHYAGCSRDHRLAENRFVKCFALANL